MRTDMELWTEVRRRVLTNKLSLRGACKKYGLGWHSGSFTPDFTSGMPGSWSVSCAVVCSVVERVSKRISPPWQKHILGRAPSFRRSYPVSPLL